MWLWIFLSRIALKLVLLPEMSGRLAGVGMLVGAFRLTRLNRRVVECGRLHSLLFVSLVVGEVEQ